MHRQSVVMQGDVHRKQSAPLCKENTAVARRESVALPLIEVVVVLQPLVQEVADVEFDRHSNAAIDGLDLVRLVGRQLVVVSLAVRLEVVDVLRVARLALRVQVVLEEEVARGCVRDARLDVAHDHRLVALLGPSDRRRPIDPRFPAPAASEVS